MSRLDSVTDWKKRARNARYSAGLLAEQLGVTQRHLRLYYSEVFGRPTQYLLDRLRLAEASRLLAEERQTVGETARILHYSSVQVFCKQFKRFYDCTPSEFVRRYSLRRERLIKDLYVTLESHDCEGLLPPPPWKQVERALLSKYKPQFRTPHSNPRE